MNVKDRTLIFEINRCGAYILHNFDRKQEEKRERGKLRGIHYAIMAAQIGEPLKFDADEPEDDAIDAEEYFRRLNANLPEAP